MSAIETADGDDVVLPSMTIRMVLLGMLAMHVLNTVILIFVLYSSAVLLLMFFAKGSVGLELILAVIGVSLLVGVVLIGKWFFAWLFSSTTKRALISAFLVAWYVLIAVAFAPDIGPVIAGGVFGFAIWDVIFRRSEMS